MCGAPARPPHAALCAAQGCGTRQLAYADLRSALEAAVAEPGPYLLNVKVTPDENVYPMVPAGGAISEMILGNPQPVEVTK